MIVLMLLIMVCAPNRTRDTDFTRLREVKPSSHNDVTAGNELRRDESKRGFITCAVVVEASLHSFSLQVMSFIPILVLRLKLMRFACKHCGYNKRTLGITIYAGILPSHI